MKITNYKNCCGCATCADSCPQNCITMSFDKFGFYLPQIDKSLCIKCGRCVSVCPNNHDIYPQNDILSTYKGHAKDILSTKNQKSTSGAIFGVLAEKIISCNGRVVGVTFDEDYQNVSHVVCTTLSQVDACRGSKYIQSKTQGIYKKVKQLLKDSTPLLFSGTPCQIAGLYSYLKVIPNNLITIDFICHGVASTSFYQAYLKHVTNQPISYVGFREKNQNYSNFKFLITDTSGKQITHTYQQHFGKAFANNLISRESCGTCKYATPTRIADITLADNIIYNTETEKRFGSSFIFVNTPRGATMLDAIKESLIIEQLDSNEVIPKLRHLNHPAIPHKNRNKLLSVFKKKGYESASKFITNYEVKKNKVKDFIINLKRKLKRARKKMLKF